jgi:hypothetical protein
VSSTTIPSHHPIARNGAALFIYWSRPTRPAHTARAITLPQANGAGTPAASHATGVQSHVPEIAVFSFLNNTNFRRLTRKHNASRPKHPCLFGFLCPEHHPRQLVSMPVNFLSHVNPFGAMIAHSGRYETAEVSLRSKARRPYEADVTCRCRGDEFA